MGIFNCARTKFEAIIVNVRVFCNAKLSLDLFCAVVLEHSLTSQVTFSRFSIFEYLNCAHS